MLPSDDCEPSRRDIQLVLDALLDFLYVADDAAARGAAGFHYTVPSERIIYGCRKADLFEARVERTEDDEHAVESIFQHLLDVEQNAELEYVCGLLQDVIGDARRA